MVTKEQAAVRHRPRPADVPAVAVRQRGTAHAGSLIPGRTRTIANVSRCSGAVGERIPLWRNDLQKCHALGMRRYVLVSLPNIPLALIVLLVLEFLPRPRTLDRPTHG